MLPSHWRWNEKRKYVKLVDNVIFTVFSPDYFQILVLQTTKWLYLSIRPPSPPAIFSVSVPRQHLAVSNFLYLHISHVIAIIR